MVYFDSHCLVFGITRFIHFGYRGVHNYFNPSLRCHAVKRKDGKYNQNQVFQAFYRLQAKIVHYGKMPSSLYETPTLFIANTNEAMRILGIPGFSFMV